MEHGLRNEDWPTSGYIRGRVVKGQRYSSLSNRDETQENSVDLHSDNKKSVRGAPGSVSMTLGLKPCAVKRPKHIFRFAIFTSVSNALRRIVRPRLDPNTHRIEWKCVSNLSVFSVGKLKLSHRDVVTKCRQTYRSDTQNYSFGFTRYRHTNDTYERVISSWKGTQPCSIENKPCGRTFNTVIKQSTVRTREGPLGEWLCDPRSVSVTEWANFLHMRPTNRPGLELFGLS